MTTGILYWHIVIPGFLQREGRPTGMEDEVWARLHAQGAGPESVVLLREWDSDFRALAERIWRMQSEHCPPTICIYGYSWGGMSAVLLCRELRKRGLRVRHLALCDPVYRHRYWWGQWRALVPWRIEVPDNVDHVLWWRQRWNWPRSHEVVAANPRRTDIDHPIEIEAVHQYADDDRLFHAKCLEVGRCIG